MSDKDNAAKQGTVSNSELIEPLGDREVELINGMIEVQLNHAQRCDTTVRPLDFMVRRPGPGWKYLAGGVYEHVSGVRISLLGGARLRGPKYRYVSANDWPESIESMRLIKINGGNRKRGLMAWARKFIAA